MGGGCAKGWFGVDFRRGSRSNVPKLKVPITGMYGCPGNNGICGHGGDLGNLSAGSTRES